MAYEHHINFDKSGIRSWRGTWTSRSSAIVAIVDCFDAMTAHRAYRKSAFPPYAALHQIISQNRNKSIRS